MDKISRKTGELVADYSVYRLNLAEPESPIKAVYPHPANPHPKTPHPTFDNIQSRPRVGSNRLRPPNTWVGTVT